VARQRIEPLPPGLTDRDGDKLLTIEELGVYVKRRVPDLLRLLERTDRQSPEILPSLTFSPGHIQFSAPSAAP
jgi:hypothetical protein